MAESVFQLTGVKVYVMCPGKTETPLINSIQDALFFPELKEPMENFVKNIPGQS